MTNLYFIRGTQSKVMRNVNDNEIIKTINEMIKDHWSLVRVWEAENKVQC